MNSHFIVFLVALAAIYCVYILSYKQYNDEATKGTLGFQPWERVKGTGIQSSNHGGVDGHGFNLFYNLFALQVYYV